MSTLTDSEIKRLAKSAGLPKIMWDTVGYREKLAVFVEHARAALVEQSSDAVPEHIRLMALALLKQCLQDYPREEIDLDAASAIARWITLKDKK